ncbi:hypothetical protein HK101_007203, partial [Irineochytrium annulatum]
NEFEGGGGGGGTIDRSEDGDDGCGITISMVDRAIVEATRNDHTEVVAALLAARFGFMRQPASGIEGLWMALVSGVVDFFSESIASFGGARKSGIVMEGDTVVAGRQTGTGTGGRRGSMPDGRRGSRASHFSFASTRSGVSTATLSDRSRQPRGGPTWSGSRTTSATSLSSITKPKEKWTTATAAPSSDEDLDTLPALAKALCAAASRGNVRIIHMMFEAERSGEGAAVPSKLVFHIGRALVCAANEGRNDVVRALNKILSSMEEVNLPYDDGSNDKAFLAAAAGGHHDAVEALLPSS